MRDYVAFGLFHSTHVHISVSVINKKKASNLMCTLCYPNTFLGAFELTLYFAYYYF